MNLIEKLKKLGISPFNPQNENALTAENTPSPYATRPVEPPAPVSSFALPAPSQRDMPSPYVTADAAESISKAQPTETQRMLGIAPVFNPNPPQGETVNQETQNTVNQNTQVPQIEAVPRLSPIQQTQAQIDAINNKDYSKEVRDAEGNVVRPAGKDRDKKWSTWEKIGNAALGALIGMGQGGIGGAIVGGVRGATDRNFNEKLDDQRRLASLYPQLQQQTAQADAETKRELQQAQINNYSTDNARQADELRQRDERAFWQETARYGFDPNNPTPTQKRFIQKYPEMANMPARAASNAKTVKINGVTFEKQADGSYRETGLPVEKRNQEELFEVTDANGNKFSYWMTSENAGKVRSQLLAEGYKIEAANLNTEAGVQQYNQKQKADWENDIARQEAVVSRNQPILTQNQKRIEEINGQLNGAWTTSASEADIRALRNEKSRLEQDNAKIQGEISTAQREAQRLRNNPPTPRPFTPTQTVTGQTQSTGGRFTAKQLEDEIRRRNPNMAEADLKKLIESETNEARKLGRLME